MAITYDSLVTCGTLMCIVANCFFLGILYADWPYTHGLIWEFPATEEAKSKVAQLALSHYLHWLEVPKFIPYTMYGVVFFGFLGFAIKIFKPAEDVKYFEYGSFAVYILAICCYVSNIRFGVYSANAGEWGEVDEFTGLSVIAASEVIVVLLVLGIVVIQCALFFAKYEDDKVKTEFLMKELKTKLAQASANVNSTSSSKQSSTSTGTTSGSSKADTLKNVNKKK